jgi:HD-GYP domain-containing protein (c-di-GMP phosphodiesterase class II)
MPKLRRIQLSKSYRPVDISFLKIGDFIEFDCYVQRFKDFVIIISAGTTLGEKHLRLLSNSDRHYVKYDQHELYTKLLPSDLEHISKKMISLEDLEAEGLENYKTLEEKLEVLYSSLTQVMYDYFDQSLDINLSYVELLLQHYISIIKKDTLAYRTIINTMCKKNNHSVHSVNVALLSLGLANHLGYSISQMKIIGKAALLHDLGEKEIDKSIFEKNTTLTDAEFEQMKTHPILSYQIVHAMGIFDRSILDAVHHHHEYLDGSGYPDGLRRQRISDFTQIITVCDIFDGMTSYRSYRSKKSAITALKMIKSEYKEKIRSKFTEGLIRLFHSIYASEVKN